MSDIPNSSSNNTIRVPEENENENKLTLIPVYEEDNQPTYDEDNEVNEDYTYPAEREHFLHPTNTSIFDSHDNDHRENDDVDADANILPEIEVEELPYLYYSEEIGQFCEFFAAKKVARYWDSEAGDYVEWDAELMMMTTVDENGKSVPRLELLEKEREKEKEIEEEEKTKGDEMEGLVPYFENDEEENMKGEGFW